MRTKYLLISLFLLFGFNAWANNILPDQLKSIANIVVSPDGSGDYTTVQAAIDAVPNNNASRFVVYIKNGVYYEKVRISSSKTNLVLIGESIDSTIIQFDDYAAVSSFECTTVKVSANDFLAMNLTIENSYDKKDSQALALYTDGDRQVFVHCRLVGWQDTYYSGSKLRAYFKDCLIIGAVDYIYGATTVLFDSCQIHNVRSGGYVTAASTDQNNKFGYVFRNCWVTGGKGITGVYFGRPWRPYSYTLFYDCYISPCIAPVGWHNWGNVANEATARYLEYNNYGPGARPESRVNWGKQLTNAEAAEVTMANIYAKSNNPNVMRDDWLPTVETDTLCQLIKEHTNSFLSPLNVSAKLSDLKLNGTTPTDFHSDSLLIIADLPAGTTTVPELLPTLVNPATTVSINYPDTVPGWASVDINTPYHAANASYDVYFSVDGAYYSANLAGLTINKVDLPGFDPDVTTYDVLVPEGTTRYMPIKGIPQTQGARVRYVKPTALPGQYEITVTALDGVTTKSYLFNVSYGTSSVDQINQGVSLTIQNPIGDVLRGELTTAVAGVYTFEIYNATGSLLISQPVVNSASNSASFTINTSSLASGIYFYRLTGAREQTEGRLVK